MVGLYNLIWLVIFVSATWRMLLVLNTCIDDYIDYSIHALKAIDKVIKAIENIFPCSYKSYRNTCGSLKETRHKLRGDMHSHFVSSREESIFTTVNVFCGFVAIVLLFVVAFRMLSCSLLMIVRHIFEISHHHWSTIDPAWPIKCGELQTHWANLVPRVLILAPCFGSSHKFCNTGSIN